MATNRGKIHGGKSVLNVHVASGEFGEITRGETTRFYCTTDAQLVIKQLSDSNKPDLSNASNSVH